MRRWGVIVTLFYAVVVLALLLPGALVIQGVAWKEAFTETFGDSGFWVWAAIPIAGQALLFLRVDRSWRKLRPRARVALTATAMGCATALLFCSIAMALLAAGCCDAGSSKLEDFVFSNLTAIWLGLWGLWGLAFFFYYRGSPARMASIVRWLVTGSILELLVAVPAHVIARRRDECSAPAATAFGIMTGTAIMLMCFGPSVIALYQQRRKRYRAAASAHS